MAEAMVRPSRLRRKVDGLLEGAGIRIDGDRPWDLHVRDERFFRRVLAEASLGLGESYMAGWWECERIDEMIARVLSARLDRTMIARTLALDVVRARILNLQSRRRAFMIGEKHYDIGNRLYERMLDSRMNYSCGYWKNATTLEQAQEAKLELVARKLLLQPGMRVLDIGCGWGGAARFLAERYGCEVVGVTVSRQQVEHARQRGSTLPVEIRLQDYREVDGRFDRVFSIGMFEHVGVKNYPEFMRVVRRLLVDDGLCLLHTIGGNRSVHQTEPWVSRYIFPNSMLPSARQITTAVEGVFVIEDWHNFGAYYDTTLMHWFANFDAAWPELRSRY
ncbi:MAG TPA: cyclopropane fatty acyl phospholipid synthase, partial [Spirochaetia bacterium]|nr:cyclopropane fatty acyl phospholipid synthase [Spirochaetia bacterium]